MTVYDSRARAPDTSIGKINTPKAADVLAEELRGRDSIGRVAGGNRIAGECARVAKVGR